jgi:hypothetical protein
LSECNIIDRHDRDSDDDTNDDNDNDHSDDGRDDDFSSDRDRDKSCMMMVDGDDAAHYNGNGNHSDHLRLIAHGGNDSLLEKTARMA